MRPEPEAARTPLNERSPGQPDDAVGEQRPPAWGQRRPASGGRQPEDAGAAGSTERPGSTEAPGSTERTDVLGTPGADGSERQAEGGSAEALILADVAALTAERDEYLGDLQRLKADFDNYRKRVQRLQEEQSARGVQDLVTKLLPVLDNLDLAETHLGGGEGESEEGRALGQVRSQVLDVLAKEGLERVDRAEVPFDPSVHDAVAHVPAEGEGGSEVTVEEVLRAGYRWHSQVLRPAMVRVRG